MQGQYVLFYSKMTQESSSWIAGLGVMGTLIFLLLCNVYQPNAQIAALTLTTIFMSIVWLIIIELVVVGVLLLILTVAGALLS